MVYSNKAMKDLDNKAALVVFGYYLNHAKNLEWGLSNEYILTKEQRMILAKAAASTASLELRHLRGDCMAIYTSSYKFYKHCLITIPEGERSDAFKSFVKLSKSWGFDNHIDFLIDASKIFAGKWTSSMGGAPWSNCCWFAAQFLKEARDRDGRVGDISWETFLCCCHNTRRWLNKLGYGVMSVLKMGLNAHPQAILEFSDKTNIIGAIKENYLADGSTNNKLVPDWDLTFLPLDKMGEMINLHRNDDDIDMSYINKMILSYINGGL